MEIALFQLAASIGGIGGLLAAAIFVMYRVDRKETFNQMREDRQFVENRLTKLLELDQQSREHNTQALTELSTLIQRLNGKLG